MTNAGSRSDAGKQVLEAVLPTDEVLMARLCAGHLDAGGILFERYRDRIYNFFLRLTADRPLSEDLTQSVFERVLRYRASYREGMPFRAWIFQIARHVRADQLKKRPPLADAPELALGLLEDPSTPSLSLERKEDIHRMLRALGTLPETQRELLVLTRFQQLKYREVGQMLNLSEGAVKVRVFRALRALREAFDKQPGL